MSEDFEKGRIFERKEITEFIDELLEINDLEQIKDYLTAWQYNLGTV